MPRQELPPTPAYLSQLIQGSLTQLLARAANESIHIPETIEAIDKCKAGLHSWGLFRQQIGKRAIHEGKEG